MKAYLITMLTILVLNILYLKRERPPYSDGEMVFTNLCNIALGGWTIYLLCQL